MPWRSSTSELILQEHRLDDLADHVSPDVEVDREIAQESPFARVDLAIRQQEIHDDRERRRSHLISAETASWTRSDDGRGPVPPARRGRSHPSRR